MIQGGLEHLVPAFIMQDRNGRAIVKAISAGLQITADAVAEGVKILTDVEYAPEWRLDELAWEFDIPYDKTADIEIKRRWIREVYPLFAIYGTPAAIKRYLSGRFEVLSVDEQGFGYYMLSILFSGVAAREDVDRILKMAEIIKNVRTHIHRVAFQCDTQMQLYTGLALASTDTGLYAAPDVNIDAMTWLTDEDGIVLKDDADLVLLDEEESV